MRTILLLLIFLLPSFLASAQHVTYTKTKVAVFKTAVASPMDITEDWLLHLQNIEMPKPGTDRKRI